MADSITTLSLCSGVGWIDEAVAAGCRYFGWRHRVAAYCEWDAYAASVLLARMEESSLEPAPVWSGDLGQFDGAAFRGAVDGITAGFPCQPWSAAGKQLGTEDERWLWPAIVRIVADVEPGFVFLENVAALIAGGGLEYVLSDLAKMGFDAEWCCLTAEAVGAAHRRERVFILAYSESWGEWQRQRLCAASGAGGESWAEGLGEAVDHSIAARFGQHVRSGRAESVQHRGSGVSVADAERAITGTGTGQERATGKRRNRLAIDGPELDDSAGARHSEAVDRTDQRTSGQRRGKRLLGDRCGAIGDAASESAQGRRREHASQRISGPAGGSLFAPGPGADWSGIPEHLYPATERGFRMLVDGRAVVLDESRADQLRCSGNGVVALQGAVAFVELVRRTRIR